MADIGKDKHVSTDTTLIKVDVWSDVACPWCYLGKRRLERALESFVQRPAAPPVQIEYHSYQLNPDLPADFEGRHSKYLAERLGSRRSGSRRRTTAYPGWGPPWARSTTWIG